MRSISNRPECKNNRSKDGHRGNRHSEKLRLLDHWMRTALTERKTRAEIIGKYRMLKARAVVEETNRLEASLGRESSRKLFKSITADDGLEFMDFEGIEKSSDGTKITELYFAHPYCASERGTNENHNRMFRRFYPKDTDFSKLTPKLFIKFQTWMNNYPRKMKKSIIVQLQNSLIANCLLKQHPEPVKRNHIDEHSQQPFASKYSTCAQ